MKTQRRDILKLFGLSTAAFGSQTLTETVIEQVTDPTVQPLRPPQFIPQQGMALDVRRGCLYSAQEFSETGHVIQFFEYDRTTPWGTQVTYADTNLYQAGRLDAPECFAILKVGCVFSPACDPEDVARFIDQSTLAVWIGQKNFYRKPLSSVFSIGNPSADLPFPKFPVEGMADISTLPLIIEHGISFFGQISTKPQKFNKRVRMWMVYEGLHGRGIQ